MPSKISYVDFHTTMPYLSKLIVFHKKVGPKYKTKTTLLKRELCSGNILFSILYEITNLSTFCGSLPEKETC